MKYPHISWYKIIYLLYAHVKLYVFCFISPMKEIDSLTFTRPIRGSFLFTNLSNCNFAACMLHVHSGPPKNWTLHKDRLCFNKDLLNLYKIVRLEWITTCLITFVMHIREMLDHNFGNLYKHLSHSEIEYNFHLFILHVVSPCKCTSGGIW